MNKPKVPPPSKLRAAADALLPVPGVVPDQTEEKPLRSRLMTVAENLDFQAPNQLKQTEDKWKDLNFKVDEQYHRRIKQIAANWGMSMKELLEAAMQNWIDLNGESPKTVQEYQRFKDLRRKVSTG